jgi:regulator of replication initiation timing
MATDKKHIAVYLAPEVEQALIAFCERKGLKSKKGIMFSAGVNAALSEFFGTSGTKESNTPQASGNTPCALSDNTPCALSDNTPIAASNISTNIDNIPSESFIVEGLPGKLQVSKDEIGLLTQELEDAKSSYEALLESSTHVTNKLRLEVQELRSQLEQECADREQVEAELAEVKQNPVTASRNLPEAADLLNRFKTRRKKSTVSLADVETLLEIIEKFCDDTLAGL